MVLLRGLMREEQGGIAAGAKIVLQYHRWRFFQHFGRDFFYSAAVVCSCHSPSAILSRVV